MKSTCPICKFESADVPGPEVWPRECGFFEIQRPESVGVSGVWSVCSVDCAMKLLSGFGRELIRHLLNQSRTWKCRQCGDPLNKNHDQPSVSKFELVPHDCVKITPPRAWGHELVFCCDACAVKYLESRRTIPHGEWVKLAENNDEAHSLSEGVLTK